MHWRYCINMQFYANTGPIFCLYLILFPSCGSSFSFKATDSRLSQVLSHSMGVYKYFSIKNSEDQLCYCISIKNALAWGKNRGSLIRNQNFKSTSLNCFFSHSSPPPNIAIANTFRCFGDCYKIWGMYGPAKNMLCICYWWACHAFWCFLTECSTFLLPDLPLFPSMQMSFASFVPKYEKYQLKSVITAATKELHS